MFALSGRYLEVTGNHHAIVRKPACSRVYPGIYMRDVVNLAAFTIGSQCWNYGQTGAATISETVCPSAFPSCGYFAFVFSTGATYSNFGCSTRAYALIIELVDGTSSSVFLEGGGSTQTTARPSTVYITPAPNPTITVTPTQTGTNIVIGTTSVPDIGSHNDRPFPTGAVVGGVVGGLTLVCLVAFLIWFILRRRRQGRELKSAKANAATASAYQAQQGPVEIDGKQTQGLYAPPQRVYTPIAVEKHASASGVQEYYQPQSQEAYRGVQVTHQQSSTPPPFYAQPSPAAHHARQISEISQPRQLSNDAPHPEGAPNAAMMNEISENNSGWEPIASTVELPTARTSNPNQQIYEDDKELEGGSRSSYQAPPTNPHEMNVSHGGVTRRPIAGQMPIVDMSGAPMSEEYRDI
ncbi:hypothetical protein BGZ60DRAFT_128629 [Tricladium varicosporioides]|nr:hypothetical protein BGZ60DRAFT_128629 [Hymenoscyphus varicosporioides]